LGFTSGLAWDGLSNRVDGRSNACFNLRLVKSIEVLLKPQNTDLLYNPRKNTK